MANIKSNSSGKIALHWRTPEGTNTSLTLVKPGKADRYPLTREQIAKVWDTALALGRATQGRRRGKPLPQSEAAKEAALTPREAIDQFIEWLEGSEASPRTVGIRSSCLRGALAHLGNRWDNWLNGWYRCARHQPVWELPRGHTATHWQDAHLPGER